MISESAAASVRKTGMPFGQLANLPTGRLCDAEAADAQPAPDVVTFSQVTRPSISDDGLYAAELRFGEARVMAVLAALVGFCYLVAGFTNGQLVERVRALIANTVHLPADDV